MWAEDVQPSRIRRARQKVLDILDQRDEGVTGLVVFAGDAHVVTPLTDDIRTIENLLSALDPGIMPIQGSNPTQAMLLAADLLATSGLTNGSILLMTDGLPKLNDGVIRAAMTEVGGEVSILAIGTESGAPVPIPTGGFLRDDANNIVIPSLNLEELESAASMLEARLETISVDDSDVGKLLSVNPSSVSASDSLERKTDTWIDEGHWLALLAAFLLLPLFRRGALSVVLVGILFALPETACKWLDDFWSTPDQQASDLLKMETLRRPLNALKIQIGAVLRIFRLAITDQQRLNSGRVTAPMLTTIAVTRLAGDLKGALGYVHRLRSHPIVRIRKRTKPLSRHCSSRKSNSQKSNRAIRAKTLRINRKTVRTLKIQSRTPNKATQNSRARHRNLINHRWIKRATSRSRCQSRLSHQISRLPPRHKWLNSARRWKSNSLGAMVPPSTRRSGRLVTSQIQISIIAAVARWRGTR